MEILRVVKSFLAGLFFLAWTPFVFAYNYPEINSIGFSKNPIFNIYYNDAPAEIPIYINYNPGNTGLGQYHYWQVPDGYLKDIGSCDIPLVNGAWGESKNGGCTINLVLPSQVMNALYQGVVTYSFAGKSSHGRYHWNTFDTRRSTQMYSVRVIPHPINLDIIPEQHLVAGTSLTIHFKNRIRYFDENVMAGDKPSAWITAANNGLSLKALGMQFNPATLSITGVAKQTGVYHFYLHAKNRTSTLAPRPFMIKITENPKDRPVFRENISLSAANTHKKYDVNLLGLLEDNVSFMVSNEVTFKIDDSVRTEESKWLRIENGTHLVGEPDITLAGQEIQVPIIAHSNTGGDSKPAQLSLAIAIDPGMKPVLKDHLELNAIAGGKIYYNMQHDIIDPTPVMDGSLRVVIDEIKIHCVSEECNTSWLKVMHNQPTILEGMVPSDATGQIYKIRVHANNMMGGDSEKKDIMLHVNIDPDKKSALKLNGSDFLPLKPGQPFLHDFVASRDVYPEYEEVPYTIDFAKGSQHPFWLRFENNTLIATKVPEDLSCFVVIFVEIKNIPGGSSGPIKLLLRNDLKECKDVESTGLLKSNYSNCTG